MPRYNFRESEAKWQSAWEKEASIRAQAAYNPDDIDGHWGWTWKEI